MARDKASISLKTKIIGLLSVVLFVLLAVDIAWTVHNQKQVTESNMLEESRVLVTEMAAVWDFISVNQDTINYTFDGAYEYKGLHCAIAGKSVAAFFSRNSDYQIRFTNINPRNFHNSPDQYEETALVQFSENPTTDEYYGVEEYEGEPAFRYVSAMKVSESCVECHGDPAGEIDPTGYQKEGWKIGDVAGAVSVVVPAERYFSSMNTTVVNNVMFFLFIVLCMVVIIYFALTRLITHPLERLRHTFVEMSDGSSLPQASPPHDIAPAYSSKEIESLFSQFDNMAGSLCSLYSNLESEVDERTTQLSEANAQLELQRKHVEEVNTKLQQDNQYKSDFLAIVSHELRTPLTSILAFADLMEDSISSENSLVRQQLEEIDKNGRILLEMVDNVLETARIQAGSEKINEELIDLNDIVGMVEASSTSLAQKKNITLTTVVSPEVPLILSDWEKVRRIMVNLVSNAIKFTQEEGMVRVALTYDATRETVTIEVVDNGVGVPADKQALIFERFTQENMSTVRRYGGSGLGLSLVKDLTTMLGGSLSLESAPGTGSAFRVVLPAKRQKEV